MNNNLKWKFKELDDVYREHILLQPKAFSQSGKSYRNRSSKGQVMGSRLGVGMNVQSLKLAGFPQEMCTN